MLYRYWSLVITHIGRLLIRLSESDSRESAFRDLFSTMWKHDTVVWVAKLKYQVNNELLQKNDAFIEPDSGSFTPFITYVPHKDEDGSFKLEGHRAFLTYQLPIEGTFKSLTTDDNTHAQSSKKDWDAKQTVRDEIKKKLAAKRGKKKGP